MKIGIVGYGFVGKAVHRLFKDAVVYDPAAPELSVSKNEINLTDTVFICVPTPSMEDGQCDISIVEQSLKWLEVPLVVIRSTISPGSTDKFKADFPEKKIIFQPEFIGETVGHAYTEENQGKFVILGGNNEDCSKLVEVYQTVYGADVKFMFLPSLEAELVKYFVNTTIAARVTLSNEFYNICKAFGANYDLVREGYLLDPRMGRHFTFVYPDKRGFSGKCIPKDVSAIKAAASKVGYKAKFVEDILANNYRIQNNEF